MKINSNDFNRIDGVRGYIEELSSEIKFHLESTKHLGLETVFDKFIRKDNGGFAEYLRKKRITRGNRKSYNQFSGKQIQSLAKGVCDLKMLDFEDVDSDQKAEVVSYLSNILEEGYVLKTSYEVEKSFFAYAANFWVEYLEDACSADILDDEILFGFASVGNLLSKINLADSLSDEHVASDIHKSTSGVFRKKTYAARDKKYKTLMDKAKKMFINGDKRTREEIAEYLCKEVNKEALDQANASSKKYERETEESKRDPKFLEKTYNAAMVSPARLAKKLILMESLYREQS